jgi:glutathione S-transferase
VGNSFTAADIVLASALGWAQFVKVLGDYPKLVTYLQNFEQRPAYQRSMAD